jgi:hypothetical protein
MLLSNYSQCTTNSNKSVFRALNFKSSLTESFLCNQTGLFKALQSYFGFFRYSPSGCNAIAKSLQLVNITFTCTGNISTTSLLPQFLKFTKFTEKPHFGILPLRQVNLVGMGRITIIARLLAKHPRHYYKLPSFSKQLLLRTLFTNNNTLTNR